MFHPPSSQSVPVLKAVLLISAPVLELTGGKPFWPAHVDHLLKDKDQSENESPHDTTGNRTHTDLYEDFLPDWLQL